MDSSASIGNHHQEQTKLSQTQPDCHGAYTNVHLLGILYFKIVVNIYLLKNEGKKQSGF